MSKDKRNEKYNKRMEIIWNYWRKSRKWIMKSWKLLYYIARLIIPLLFSPIIILILFIILFIIALIGIDSDWFETAIIKELPYEVLTKEDITGLWFEIHQEWEFRGKIVWCENFELPRNIYTSMIDDYAESNYESSSKVYSNLCLYNKLYIKKASWDFEIDERQEILRKIENKLQFELSTKDRLFLKQEESRIKKELSDQKKALDKLELRNIGESKFRDYEKWERWFKRLVDYPIRYFEIREKELSDMLFYDYIWREYWNASPEWIEIPRWKFGIFSTEMMYNTLTELWTNITEENIFKDFLNWNHWLPDFLDEMNRGWEYHDFVCPICRKDSWCDCTWDPDEDYNANYEDDEIWELYFNMYLEFMRDLIRKKVVFVSEEVKSPYRNFTKSGKDCVTDVKLTQRDWESRLRLDGFLWYPEIGWIPTHAWLDLAAKDSCNGKNTPIFSISDWVVVFESYSQASWWHSLIVKTEIANEIIYIRYSHMLSASELNAWDFVTSETVIWLQWTSGPSSWEHLDLTIYKGETKYNSYLRDTLSWWWILPFTFEDMMTDTFADYTLWSYTNEYCYNCKK